MQLAARLWALEAARWPPVEGYLWALAAVAWVEQGSASRWEPESGSKSAEAWPLG